MNPIVSVVFPEWFVKALDRYCNQGGKLKITRSKVVRILSMTNLIHFPLLQGFVKEERRKFEASDKRHKNPRKVEGRLR